MTIPEKAAAWAADVARDDSHGYDQGSRWGPDYDCSSLCISAYKQAGVPLACTYTGNMRSNMLDNGFVEANVNLATGAGLEVGDILLNVASHAAIYIGNGQLVNAGGNEWGGTTGGQTGDQTGREIRIMGYYNFPWDYCLRYARKEPEPSPAPAPSGEYIVQAGDSLWAIAEKLLGNGSRYLEIMQLNGLTSIIIYPGQVLKIPGYDGSKTITVTVTSETYDILKLMAGGWGKTFGETIDAIVDAL